jgi:glutaminase
MDKTKLQLFYVKLDGVEFSVGDIPVEFKIRSYSNSEPAILIICKDDGSQYGTLSVNLPPINLGFNELAIKAWSENEELAKAAMETGLFEDTGKRIETGFVEAQVWRLKNS